MTSQGPVYALLEAVCISIAAVIADNLRGLALEPVAIAIVVTACSHRALVISFVLL
jgi:hypothetical protein